MNGEGGEDMEGKVKYGPDLRRLLRVIRFLVRRRGEGSLGSCDEVSAK